MGSRVFHAFLVLLLACGLLVEGGEQAGFAAASETYPNLEVTLDPPSSPFPGVSAQIGKLEAAREAMEDSEMNEVLQAYRKAKAKANTRIGLVVGRAIRGFHDAMLLQSRHTHGGTSFLASTPSSDAADGFLYAVKVMASAGDTSEVNVSPEIADLEHHRSVLEGKRFRQVRDAMGEMTDVVVKRLKAELQAQLATLLERPSARDGVAFLAMAVKELPQQVNVRVVPSKYPFPTILSLVEDMEKRRDLSEDLITARIKQLLLQLLEDENEMIVEALGKNMARVAASFSSTFASSSL